jgi:GTP1/Obg family GTP-binding protein
MELFIFTLSIHVMSPLEQQCPLYWQVQNKLAVVIVVEEIGHDFSINDTKKVTKDWSG